MPIESGTTIQQLDNLWPLVSDFIQEGDDHLRLLKNVLKSQFPGVGGNGFDIPIIATEVEINHLDGVSSNIQQQFTDLSNEFRHTLYAPSGTRMVFHSDQPPVGWIKATQYNDYMLRTVTGTGGGAGGSDTPISFDTSHRHTTGDHVLNNDQVPAHSHSYMVCNINTGSQDHGLKDFGGLSLFDLNVEEHGGLNKGSPSPVIDQIIGASGGGNLHNHGDTSFVTKSFKPKYINTIIAVKS